MKYPVRSAAVIGAVFFLGLCLGAGRGAAQMPAPGAAVAPRGADDILRIRKILAPTKEKTPIYQTSVRTQTTGRQTDWWRVGVEFETKPDWIDELELTWYVFVEDMSNKKAPTMYSSAVTYVNVPAGRHVGDMFLHPNTIARVGPPKFVAVEIKHRGAVLATESTAQTPNWWTQFSPVPGVLLNRSQTPFFLIDYDSYNAIKPAAASR
ncbi:MAG: hypothetical protein KBC66_09315 [Kiritimatiellae bacterium]|jgi:hypothetical protein|nr:hypothetical protein [Kiritimatiellia bacterium]NLD88814.1 hypothetical protein [Lentisphaerota bacterium]HOU20646.1 hypothetical protein [Kiritimatiellia bacterium]HPC19431.1 hypothetical protein [Kiritimatiellia bacterium]HQN79467.1 hypothetical protein [Kiritimatiellia bacterium]